MEKNEGWRSYITGTRRIANTIRHTNHHLDLCVPLTLSYKSTQHTEQSLNSRKKRRNTEVTHRSTIFAQFEFLLQISLCHSIFSSLSKRKTLASQQPGTNEDRRSGSILTKSIYPHTRQVIF